MSGSTAPRRYYRPELDVIRFVAFATVFLHHGLPNWWANGSVKESVVTACGFGLCLFFTLSAYLITTLLLRERTKTGTVDLPRFYKRRMLRIWPLYFAAVAYGAIFDGLHGAFWSHRVWYAAAMVMAANLFGSLPSSVPHLWSISVEEQFYVFWPGVMRRLTSKQITLAALALIVLANATLARFGRMHADTDLRIWWNTLVQMEMFAAGIMLAVHDEARSQRQPATWMRATGFLFLPAAWFAAIYQFHIKGVDLPAQGPVQLCIGYGLVALSCAGLIYVARGMQKWPQWLVYLGKISYGLYIFHIPMLRFATYALPHSFVLVRSALALGLTIAISAASYRFFETPFLRLKEKYEVVLSRPVN